MKSNITAGKEEEEDEENEEDEEDLYWFHGA